MLTFHPPLTPLFSLSPVSHSPHQGVGAINILADDGENRAKLVAAGACEALVAVLDMHRDNLEVAQRVSIDWGHTHVSVRVSVRDACVQ
jgi:hypothetical protein